MQQPSITTIEKEIAREERIVGLRAGQRLTPARISRRQHQVAVVVVLVTIALLGVAFSPAGTTLLRGLTVALAAAIAAYALEQNRHLRRLYRLTCDSQKITLAVVDVLTNNGALRLDEDLLMYQAGLERSGTLVASGLADVLLADVARVRLVGPSGEVPIIATHMGAIDAPDDPTVARHALRRGHPMKGAIAGNRTVLAIPLMHHGEPVAVLEAVSPAHVPYEPRDAALADAYAKGALSSLRALA
jgi:hypothetical protein